MPSAAESRRFIIIEPYQTDDIDIFIPVSFRQLPSRLVKQHHSRFTLSIDISPTLGYTAVKEGVVN